MKIANSHLWVALLLATLSTLPIGQSWAQAGGPKPLPPAVRPAGGPVGGRGPTLHAPTPAEQLVGKATVAQSAGNFAAAYQALALAYPLAPSSVHFYLGKLAAAQQQPVAARDLLRRFLADPTIDANEPLRQDAQQLLASLPLGEAGEVAVGAPRGAQVQLDGRLVGLLPLALPLLVASGSHRLAVSQGRWRAETEVTVRTARQVEVRFKFGSEIAVVSRPPALLLCEKLPDGDPAAADSLHQRLASAVKRENYSLLSFSTALAYAPILDGCQAPLPSTACCAALARQFAVERTLAAEVTRQSDSWQLALSLRDPEVDGTLDHRSSCPGCRSDQAAQQLSDGVATLLGQAAGPRRGQLQVESQPSGAELWLAGERIGTTPYSRPLWAGSYPIELRRSGFLPEPLSVEVVAERPVQLTVALRPVLAVLPAVATAPPQRQRPAWRLGVGSGGIAAGALLFGFGISALAVSGSCVVDGLASCNRVYGSSAVGGTLVGLGGGLAIGGALLIALPIH